MLCLALALSHCASTGPRDEWSGRLASPVYAKASEYLDKARQAEGQDKLLWQLQAGRAYAQAADWAKVDSVLAALKGQLTQPAALAAYQLLAAQATMAREDYAAAAALLASPMPQAFETQRLRLKSRLAELSGDVNAQIQALAQLAEASSDSVQQARISDRIWSLLPKADTSQLDASWAPWLSLQQLAKEKRGPALKDAISAWQQQYPNSLPGRYLPQSLEQLTQITEYQPTKVALLLPLTGSFAAQGQAIRDGFVAAWLDSGQPAQLVVLDSANDAVAAWQQAKSEGADMLVGPLLRPQVEALQQSGNVDVPWLALNRVFRPGVADSYFFALAPEDEAAQAAEEAVDRKAEHPLLIGLDSATNNRQAQAFIERWRQYGHEEPVDMRLFGNRQQLEQGIRDLLKINDSKARIGQVEDLLGHDLVAEARSRRDVDFLYLLGDKEEVGLMKAFIDVTISPFADPIAAYTSSRGHPDLENPAGLRDFNGLSFSEMPYFVSQQGPALAMRQLLTQLRPHWPSALERLFAMGYDAARLLPRMATLRIEGSEPVQGISGSIGIDGNGVIHRRLQWVTIRGGNTQVQDHVIPPLPEQDSQGPAL
ncbi:penicillin-binding protein activator [Gallaecimonas kandeliae]|uniref:penicillin-binding protein activator n=1 Tax=Gallaecimonas kandeliae TaxID=3029055 RepID=UPI00264944AE|nr:penicillin-binding protein activator [Gallaecimonas kandeliae]WKE66074.1 penicillin-binding protein activator [Gallaecimonas kandeliae]